MTQPYIAVAGQKILSGVKRPNVESILSRVNTYDEREVVSGMEEKELKKLLSAGEAETLEFKENFDRETIEAAGVFANTKGGNIIIGISDINKVKGVQVGGETLKNWANQISQSTEPWVIPEIELGETNKKRIVIIKIKEFPIKPVSVKGRYFRRVGNSNRIMTCKK